jgi:hypothetical protein
MTDEHHEPVLIRTATYKLTLIVKHWSGSTNSVTLESGLPFGAIHTGDRITIGGLEGFPKSMLTMGRVASVAHTFTGSHGKLEHTTTVHVDQGRE